MATIHLLTQYIWPDAAPTAIYAEQLAARLESAGHTVRLVGGKGGYRPLRRVQPIAEIVYLDHREGRRGSLRETFAEYVSVTRAFRDYIARFVRHADTVIVTSAPPNTVTLARSIRSRGASAIYWLQDYYPELVRGIFEYPAPVRKAFRRYWDRQLQQWDQIVRIGNNLGGPKNNSVVIRNWPTLSFGNVRQPEPRTAIYSGNLGFGHDVPLLIKTCKELRAAGYRITVRCDGRGARKLPGWLQPEPLEADPEKLCDDLQRHEIHLIAGSPKITEAVFPSKIWNSLALGREIVCTGFAGAMLTELDASKEAPFERHLDQWVELVEKTIGVEQPARQFSLA